MYARTAACDPRYGGTPLGRSRPTGWLESGQKAGEGEARPRKIPTGPGAERMGWPAAALVILGSSVLLWLGVGASVAWVMGWR